MTKSQQNNGAYKVTKIGILLEIPPSGSSFNTCAEAMPKLVESTIKYIKELS